MAILPTANPTTLPLLEKQRKETLDNAKAKLACEARGGTWDEVRKVCIMPDLERKKEEEEKSSTRTEIEKNKEGVGVFQHEKTRKQSGVVLPDGRTFIGLSPEEVAIITGQEEANRTLPEGSFFIGKRAEEERLKNQFLSQGQELASQVGQINENPEPVGTEFNAREALSQSLINSIPSSIQLAAQLGVLGGTIGATAGAVGGGATGGPAGAAAGGAAAGLTGAEWGAIAGFVSGMARGVISNTKKQRQDSVSSQKKTLDDGKQALKSWITLAKAYPSNRYEYFRNFNTQLQLIKNAHVNMQYDVNRDIAKFETAAPALYEFKIFYDPGQERDSLVEEMRQALQTIPSNIDIEILELNNKYNNEIE